MDMLRVMTLILYTLPAAIACRVKPAYMISFILFWSSARGKKVMSPRLGTFKSPIDDDTYIDTDADTETDARARTHTHTHTHTHTSLSSWFTSGILN